MASNPDDARLMSHDGPSAIPTAMLETCAGRHARLCPRQVLGLRIGLLGSATLGLAGPRTDKRLITVVETDGCAVDGISSATGCSLGHRTLKVMDFGKVAATFIDVKTGAAVRIAPLPGIRQAAERLFPRAKSRWHAQLEAYQVMAASSLLAIQPVELPSLDELIGQPGVRAVCAECGEEVLNHREVIAGRRMICRACAGQRYYIPVR